MSGLLVVCGLLREAELIAGPGIVTVAGGGDRARLEARLAALSQRSFSAVLSFGLAGSLAPDLEVGDVLLPEAGTFGPISTALSARIAHRLAAGSIAVTSRALIAASDRPASTAAAKAALRAETGAVAVDMESHVAAAYAALHGLPFAVLRVISDKADRDIPPAALAAMRPDGGIDIGGVLRSLARAPWQLPALLGVGRDGAKAFGVLRRVGAACRDFGG